MRGTLLILATLLVPAAAIAGATPVEETVPSTLELTAPGSNDPWARELVRTLPQATTVNDQDGDKLFDDLEAAWLQDPLARLPTIVVFQHDVDPEAGLAQAQAIGGPIQASHVFHIIPGFAAELSLDQAERIAQLDAVRQLELDHPASLELDTATVFMGVDKVQEELGVTGDRDGNETNFTKDDVTIAVLDTGFHGGHADLDDGKIIHFNDCAGDETEAYDSGTHGTHVASIAAGTGDGDPAYTGVAPGAAIVGIKISGEGCSATSDAIAGYEWIVEHKDHYGIDVSTISFGFGTATDGTTALEMAVDEVWEAGVVNFKSTGNSGPERRTITVPAASRGILATGAMLDPGSTFGQTLSLDGLGVNAGFQLATFSSRGPTTDGRVKPDITAPGVSIEAADANTDDGYVSFSGTSMASPFAAGVAALVLDANPALSPDEVRSVLTSTTEDWGIGGPDVDYGWGRLQAATAVSEARARANLDTNLTSPVIPFHEVRAGTFSADPTVPVTDMAVAEIDVEDTTHPFAVTAIAEGKLVEILVEDPSGDLVASFSPLNPAGRQHVVSFEADETGTHTIRMIGEPGAAWVVDVTHGTAGGVPIELPTGIGIEQIVPATADANNETPLGIGVVLAGLMLAAIGLKRRG